MGRFVFEMVEIDVPYCSRTWGVGACTAVLSAATPRKCWNLRKDCAVPSAYLEGTPLTLRFCKDGPKPKDLVAFPVLSRVSTSSQSVNLAGIDPDMSNLGRQSTLEFTLSEFAYHERGIDKYQAERLTGAAQFSGVGYDPAAQGMFLAKLKARWPFYSKKPVRLVRGYLEGGVLVDTVTQNFFLEEMDGPTDGELRVKARGVLDFANGKTALAPKPSPGRLVSDLTEVATTFTVTPTGAGASYAASGRLCIGSEVMSFTRSGDVFTVVRGQRNTTARSASAGDTVQQVLSYTDQRLDAVVHDLIQNYTTTPATYLDATQRAANTAEVTRWGGGLRLTTDICAPTSVAQLLSELGDLGCTIIPDEVAQKIRIRMDRPADGETVPEFSDRTAKDVRQADKDSDRVTQVYFLSRRVDPTKSLSDDANYNSRILTVDAESMTLYGEVKSLRIATRWLDQGDDTYIGIRSIRILRRRKDSPKLVKITLDYAEGDVALGNVVALTSDELADADGLPKRLLLQAYSRNETIPLHEVEIACRYLSYDGKYGYVAPNTMPNYGAASAAQKARYVFIAPNTGVFADGTEAYKVI